MSVTLARKIESSDRDKDVGKGKEGENQHFLEQMY